MAADAGMASLCLLVAVSPARLHSAFGDKAAMKMFILGYTLFALGLITWIAGELRLLVLAYRQSLFWFFGCLFVPFVSWAFFLFNVRQAWKPVVVATLGFIVTGVGYWAGGFQFLQ